MDHSQLGLEMKEGKIQTYIQNQPKGVAPPGLWLLPASRSQVVLCWRWSVLAGSLLILTHNTLNGCGQEDKK